MRHPKGRMHLSTIQGLAQGLKGITDVFASGLGQGAGILAHRLYSLSKKV